MDKMAKEESNLIRWPHKFWIPIWDLDGRLNVPNQSTLLHQKTEAPECEKAGSYELVPRMTIKSLWKSD